MTFVCVPHTYLVYHYNVINLVCLLAVQGFLCVCAGIRLRQDFDKCRLMMLQRAREWVETMGNAQSTIAKSAASFIMAKYVPDGLFCLIVCLSDTLVWK